MALTNNQHNRLNDWLINRCEYLEAAIKDIQTDGHHDPVALPCLKAELDGLYATRRQMSICEDGPA